MAATENLSQLQPSHNSTAPRHGVITLYGYGIQVRVERGHLLIEDGIGGDRRRFRLPRVGHGLKRVAMVGSDGMISLSALRWLSDQNVSFALLERNGKVLAVTGPVSPSDAKLRRAQALAFGSELGLKIARELITRKLLGQEEVVRDILSDSQAADEISQFRADVAHAERLDFLRTLEAQAAAVYWDLFRNLPVAFPKKDPRVPEHWRTFGTRKSELTGSPRRAVTPTGAMLNYLYSLLEAESRLGATALGLDPGLGVLHVDTTARDSLACDLMEAVRPQVDRYVLTWILSQPLRREWFFEQRDGSCRLMASITMRLSETTQTWARAVAPVAEWVAQEFWASTRRKASKSDWLPTRLTQKRKIEARGKEFIPPLPTASHPEKVCRNCGADVHRGRHCWKCGRELARTSLIECAKTGRIAAQLPRANEKRTETQREHQAAQRAWCLATQPSWLTPQFYDKQIQPQLRSATIAKIASLLKVSDSYAADIRAGRRRPHPRHWQALAELARVSLDSKISISQPTDS